MTKKSLAARVGALHPSKTPDADWQRKNMARWKDTAAPSTRCSLFSDGRHRIKISPGGVRTNCLCGAAR